MRRRFILRSLHAITFGLLVIMLRGCCYLMPPPNTNANTLCACCNITYAKIGVVRVVVIICHGVTTSRRRPLIENTWSTHYDDDDNVSRRAIMLNAPISIITLMNGWSHCHCFHWFTSRSLIRRCYDIAEKKMDWRF